MAKEDSFWDKLFSSAGNALNPLNVLGAMIKFFIFGLIIGTPYLIMNLNMLSDQLRASNATKMSAVWLTLRSLLKTIWQGIFVGLSTFWDAFLRFREVIGTPEWGTIIMISIVILFTTFTVHQPLSIIFDIFDLKKKKATPKIISLFVSFFLTVALLSPLAYYVILDGQTITSGYESLGDGNNETNKDYFDNQTQEILDDDYIDLNFNEGG